MNRGEFLLAAGVGAGLGVVGAGWAFSGWAPPSWALHDDGLLVQPSYGEIGGYTLLSYSDLGWPRTAEFRVSPDGRYASTANYQRFSIEERNHPQGNTGYSTRVRGMMS